MTEELGDGESQIVLKKNDTALVVRESEPHFEMHLPKMEDETAIIPQHVVLLVAISLRLRDEAFCEEVLNWFDKKVDEAEGNTAGGEIGSTAQRPDAGAVPATSTIDKLDKMEN